MYDLDYDVRNNVEKLDIIKEGDKKYVYLGEYFVSNVRVHNKNLLSHSRKKHIFIPLDDKDNLTESVIVAPLVKADNFARTQEIVGKYDLNLEILIEKVKEEYYKFLNIKNQNINKARNRYLFVLSYMYEHRLEKTIPEVDEVKEIIWLCGYISEYNKTSKEELAFNNYKLVQKENYYVVRSI